MPAHHKNMSSYGETLTTSKIKIVLDPESSTRLRFFALTGNACFALLFPVRLLAGFNCRRDLLFLAPGNFRDRSRAGRNLLARGPVYLGHSPGGGTVSLRDSAGGRPIRFGGPARGRAVELSCSITNHSRLLARDHPAFRVVGMSPRNSRPLLGANNNANVAPIPAPINRKVSFSAAPDPSFSAMLSSSESVSFYCF
jgi:hypothetical protein